MKTLDHVEDYLELLAGYATPSLLQSEVHCGPFSLARYDVKIVDGIASETMFGEALTERQAALVLRLLGVYKKQIAKRGISADYIINQPQYRKPLRIVDRRRSICLEHGRIAIYFPYDKNLISQLKQFRDKTCGSVKYHPDNKCWYLAITEHNVNWAVTWGKVHKFEIENELIMWLDQIIEIEKQPVAIQLTTAADGQLCITNAAAELTEYIHTQGLQLTKEYLTELVALSGVLEYTVDDQLLAQVAESVRQFAAHTSHVVNSSIEQLAPVGEFARLTNTYPVYIFDPLGDLAVAKKSQVKPEVLAQFGVTQDQVLFIQTNEKTRGCNSDPEHARIVYARKIPPNWSYRIPLLISTVTMLNNGSRAQWRTAAEHLVLYTPTVVTN